MASRAQSKVSVRLNSLHRSLDISVNNSCMFVFTKTSNVQFFILFFFFFALYVKEKFHHTMLITFSLLSPHWYSLQNKHRTGCLHREACIMNWDLD